LVIEFKENQKMKKLVLLIAGFLVIASGSLMAADIAFSYGTNFLSPSNTRFATSNGRTTILEWYLDDGLTLGVVNEQTVLDYTDTASAQLFGNLALNGVRVSQQVINRVRVGIGLGSATADVNIGGAGAVADTAAVVDIIGEVTLFSGGGKKVTGALVATIIARYMNTPALVSGGAANDNITDLNGTNAGLAVKIGF
jgi:hypothetical protein